MRAPSTDGERGAATGGGGVLTGICVVVAAAAPTLRCWCPTVRLGAAGRGP